METRAPRPAQLALMVVFALSCFGLLLYLWSAFGGPVPFEPKGYRFTARFDEATQLSLQADVRISGVTVGKVVGTEPQAGRTAAQIELQDEYAPLPADSRMILRQKTLLGETYVELTPGSPGAPKLPEGGTLPDAQVMPTVELDEILRTFDPETRRALKTWVTSWAAATRGRGRDLNSALGNLPAAAEEGTDVLAVADRQEEAVSRLVADSGAVFRALGRREGAVRTLVTAGERVLATTATRDERLTEIVRILPTFLRELRPTLEEAEATAVEAEPTIAALRPVAPLVPPALRDLGALAPDARRLFLELDPLIDRAALALPALRRIVLAARPLVRVLWPIGRDLAPAVDYLGLFRQELTTMFANVAASAQAEHRPAGAAAPVKYLRVLIPVTAEAFVTQSQRLPSNRHNAYLRPGGLADLPGGLASFACDHLANPQTIPAFGRGSPPCRVQAPYHPSGAFPRLTRRPR